MSYRGIQSEMVKPKAHGGATGEAYYARPAAAGKYPGVVVIHHMPGWDEWTTEVCNKFAQHGFAAIAPNLYFRESGSPDDQAAKARAAGGMADDQVMGDVGGAQQFLRAQANSNGKVGVIGFCSGGRHTYLAACTVPGFDAAVDCWGGRVIAELPDDISPKRPKAPIDYTDRLQCPLLGIFGNEDASPSPAQVNKTEEILKKAGKTYEFHRYDGAGHGFFAVNRPGYRVEQANDGWSKVFAFYGKHLGGAK